MLKRIWRDIGQVSSHIDVFIAEFAHVQIHVVQELVCIVVGRSGSGDGGKMKVRGGLRPIGLE